MQMFGEVKISTEGQANMLVAEGLADRRGRLASRRTDRKDMRSGRQIGW
jgi:hypothetical protein